MEEKKLKEALREIIREKGRAKKEGRRAFKKAASISAAIIICLIFTIQSDTTRKNNFGKFSDYTFENQGYLYLDIIDTCVRSRDWNQVTNSAPTKKRIYRYDRVGQI